MALQQLGKYEIRSEIGRGAMGVVYKAHDPILEREVALKTMMASMGALDGESKARFYREARSAAKLTHRNIVTIYDMGEEQGIPYIAMEYLDGIDLHKKIKFGGPLPLREGLDLIRQVLHGLHYAHQFQIVHRDIKPANIYILRNGTAKILDFGIAKLASSEMTRTGMVLGTVDYMSPEQIRADKTVDGRSDLFSAGVILYEFIAGRRPFPGETITSVMYKIVHEDPPDLPDDRELPPALAEIINKALAKAPDDRYATGEEFAAALEVIIDEIDAAVPTMRVSGEEGDSQERLKSAMRLYDSASFEDSVAVLKSVLDQDPENAEAAQLMSVVEKRASGDVTMILEPGEEPVSATGSSIEEIIEEVEEEKRQTTAATGPRSEAGARDLTLRLEDSDIGTGDHRAPPEGDAAGTGQGAVPATEVLESPEAAAGQPADEAGAPPPPVPTTPPPVTAGPPAGTVPPSEAFESPVERPGPPTGRAAPATGAAASVEPEAASRPSVMVPPARPPAPSRGLSPALIGAGAVLIVTAATMGLFLFLGTGEETPEPSTPPGVETGAPGEEGAAPAVPPVTPGHLAVDAQPWAEVIRVRDTGTGQEVDISGAGDLTTPVVLDLPEGSYEITMRHPEYGEISVGDLSVAPGQITPVHRTMPGFSYSSKVPSPR